MSYWEARVRTPEEEREDELEEHATALLKALGAFRRGTGIRSPRSEREARAQAMPYEEWLDGEIAILGSGDVWDELDAIALDAGLTPGEKAALGMARVEGYSLREMARIMGTTVYRARFNLECALRKCEQFREELPCSPRALFWEEIRQKRAAIYNAPGHSWKCRRTRGEPD